PGTQFLSNQGTPVPTSVLTTPDGKPGLRAEYSSQPGFEATRTPITSREESTVNLNESNLPEQAKTTKTLSVEWTGFLNPKATGDYLLGMKAVLLACPWMTKHLPRALARVPMSLQFIWRRDIR